MSVNIHAVPKIAGPNPPGLVMALVIFADSIISMEEYLFSEVLSENPTLKEGSDVFAFFTAELGSSYSHQVETDDAGELHKHSISINYASPEELADPVLRRFRNREFVVLTTNYFGRRYLVGTKEMPLRCQVQKSTGSDSGIYGYKLDFEGETYFPAPRFTGDFATGQVITPEQPTQMIDFSQFDFVTQDWY